MQILEISPRRLTLEDRPWVLGIILAVVILFLLFLALATSGQSLWLTFAMLLMAALFGAAFVAFVRRVIVILDRDAGAVVIRSKGVLGQSEATHPLADISHASVETTVSRSTSSNGRRSTTSQTHRTVLHVGDKVVPLTEVYSSGDGAELIAGAINDWLRQSSITCPWV